MKNLGKLKLNQLSKAELDNRNLIKLTGGGSCPTTCGTCGCLYEGQPGGSTEAANHQANLSAHKYSPCVDDYDPYCNKVKGIHFPFFNLKIIFLALFLNYMTKSACTIGNFSDSTYIHIKGKSIATNSIKLSDIADSVKYIKLETNNKCNISYINEIYFSDNKIFINNGGKLLIFKSNGDFSSNIGRIGKGPGEYLCIFSFCYDSFSRQIYGYSVFDKKVKIFDENGKYIKEFKATHSMKNMFVFDGYLYYTSYDNFGSYKNTWRINLKTLKTEMISDKSIITGVNFKENKIYAFDSDTLNTIDKLYLLNKGNLKEEYFIDQNKQPNKNFYYFQIPINLNSRKLIFGNFQKNPCTYERKRIHNMKNGKRMTWLSSESIPHEPVIYDMLNNTFLSIDSKQDRKGILNDFDGEMPFWPIYESIDGNWVIVQKNNTMISVISSRDFLQWSNTNKKKDKNYKGNSNFISILNKTKIEDNPILMILYLKK